MSFAGWIIVALAVLVAVYLTPALITKRQRLVETPVEDRFSDRITIVKPTNCGLSVRGEPQRQQPAILRQLTEQPREPRPVIRVDARDIEIEVAKEGGRDMRDNTEETRSVIRRGVPSTSRQLAKLRAARAARIARENAAGQRRFVLAGVSLTLLVAFGIATWFSALSPWWLLAPVALMAGVIASGRIAYQRSVAAAEHETLMLRKLRGEKGREIPQFRPLSAAETEVVAPSVESDESEALEETVDEVAPIDEATEEPAASEWTPQPIPQPLYATDATIRRTVAEEPEEAEDEADEISAEIWNPVRPVAPSATPADAVSSEEAASQAPVAFNLEEILDHRRAQ